MRLRLSNEELVGRVPTANLTRAEVRLMLQTARPKRECYLIHRLLYFGGLRGGEVLGLMPGDLMLTQRSLFLRGGKGDKDRYVLLDPETARLLAEPVLPFGKSDEWIRRQVNGVANQCGLYQAYAAKGLRISPHSLRHAFATHRYEAGMSFSLISYLLGHALAEDTVTYTRSARRQMRAAYDECGPFAQGTRLRQTEQPDPPQPSSHPSEVERQLEFVQQPAAARAKGLPAVPAPDEVEKLVVEAASRPLYSLLFRTLHCSGAWMRQILPMQPEHICSEHPCLRLPTGLVRVDPETWRLLKESPGRWGLKAPEVQAFFSRVATATGLAARYRSMGRPLGVDALRYAFGAQCAARNIDPVSLMTLMGHKFYETTEAYLHCAAYRFLEQYDATTEAEVEP